MLAESSVDELVAELYAGVLEPARLDDFLRSLASASDSHLVSVTHQDFRDPARSRAYSVGVSPEDLARYARHAGDNIWISRSLPHLRSGAALNSDDWVRVDELKRSRYYNEFLRDIDTMHSVALCGEIKPSGGALITLCRSERSGAYAGATLELLDGLAAHWANACALRERLDATQAQGLASAPLATAVVMLDRTFRWREGNAAAEDMLAKGWWKRRPNGGMEPGAAASRQAWRRAQREAVAGPVVAGAPMLEVHDAQGRRVAIAALHPFPQPGHGATRAQYVLFVRPLAPSTAPAAERLRTLFKLTAAEAALAVALHHTGDLAAAAVVLGIGERGARTRLQSLFDKTDCRRQRDLLRLLDAIAEIGG